MDSPTGSSITSSPERTSLGSEGSGYSSSQTSPTNTFTSKSAEPLRYPLAVNVVGSPPTLGRVGNAQYTTGEIRVMADVVAQARKTGELPPTTSSAHDSEAIVHDHTALAKLRLARGDPALPPPEEYTRLRVETSTQIKDRDAKLGDLKFREAAIERVEAYLRVVGQEKKYYDLVREVAKSGGVESQGVDMERLMEEVIETVEKGIGSTASGLDSTADVFDAVACSLGGTVRTLNSATNSINSTASSLESTLGVMATQISTLNAQILALTNALQSHHAAAPTSPASPTTPSSQNYTAATALEDSVRKGIEHAISEVLHGVRASTSQSSTSPSSQDTSYSGSTLWERDSLSDSSSDSGTKVKKRSRRVSEDKTARKAGKYMKIVISRILG